MAGGRAQPGNYRKCAIVVQEALADPLGLAQDALLRKAEPHRNRTTAVVLDPGSDLDSVQPPDPEAVVGHRPDAAVIVPRPWAASASQ